LIPLVNIFSIIHVDSSSQFFTSSGASGSPFFFFGILGPAALYLSATSTASLFVCTSQTLLSPIRSMSKSSDLNVLVTYGIGVTLYFLVSSKLNIGL